MELKFWIWLIIIIGSLVARAMKKKPDASTPLPIPPRKPQSRPSQPEYSKSTSERAPRTFPREEKSGPMTFEELLREIEGTKAHRPEPEVVETSYSQTVKQTKPLEDTSYDYKQHDGIYNVYEQAKQDAFHRPSLEETMKLEDTVVKFDSFRNYQRAPANHFAAELARQIRNPQGFKRAFIMSEILQRRF